MNPYENGPAAIASVAELLKDARLGGEAQRLAPQAAGAVDFVERLLDARQDGDAARVLAYATPIRLAVWWGCLCAWRAAGGEPKGAEDDALRAAVFWVAAPSGENQKRAGSAANADDLETAAGCCAKAAFFAGSAASDEAPLQVAKPRLAARVLCGAMTLAYNQARNAGDPISFRQMTLLGLDVAAGQIHWRPLPQQAG